MLELNLIKEKTELLEKGRIYLRYIKLSCAVLVLLLIFLAIQSAVMYTKAAASNKENTRLSDEISRSKATSGVSGLEAEWAEYYRTASAIKEVVNKRTHQSALLGELSRLVPDGMLLSEIAVKADSGSTALSLDAMVFPGEVQGLDLANEFISRLSKVKGLASAKLESHEKMKINDREAESFKISVPLTH